MPPAEKSDDIFLHGIRAEMRQLNTRVGGLEGRVDRVEERCNSTGDDVAGVKTTVAVLDTKLDVVIANQDEERALRNHKQMVETEAQADQATALIKLEDTKITSRGKILASLLAVISGLIGAGIHYFA